MSTDPKRAVIYSRQSISRDPIDSLSIEFQERECSEYVVRQGWVLVGTYSDPDKKGWRRFRPAFDEMLATVAAGKADVVVLYKLSRFARNLMMQEEVVAEIADAGGDLVSITEPHMSTSPMVRQILGAVNEHYRRDQSDWLSSTFAARARKGLHHGYAPFGYRIVDRRLQVDGATGPIARQMWEWALEGHGTPEITFRLNERGVLTQRGKQWQPVTVLDILRNVTYAGSVKHRGEVVATDAHPALVSQEEFDQVQRLLDRRSSQRRKATPSWAEGFVEHACGERMYLSGWYRKLDDGTKWRRSRFRCHKAFSRRERGVIPCQHRPASVYADYAEDAIVDGLALLADRLRSPEEVAAAVERSYGQSAAKRERQRASIQRRHDDLVRQRDRLLSLVLEGKVDADLYRERDDALKIEIATVAAELAVVPPVVDLAAIRKQHTAIADLLIAATVMAGANPSGLVAPLTTLDARLVVGDGAPYLRVGPAFTTFFNGY